MQKKTCNECKRLIVVENFVECTHCFHEKVAYEKAILAMLKNGKIEEAIWLVEYSLS